MGQYAQAIIAVVGMAQQYSGGVNAKNEAKFQESVATRHEETQARDREIERKQRLLQALATRSVLSGISGTTLEGSRPMLLGDLSNFERESRIDDATKASRLSAIRAGVINARQYATQQQRSSLLSGAATLADSYAGIRGGASGLQANSVTGARAARRPGG